jgi:catechol 2,3-dioxygenase-like lactoylglutathione lyase family enzyme
MSGIIGIHHTSFTVADLAPSLAFFRDVLGLELVVHREVREGYFGQIVGLPGCVVKAAILRAPGGHLVELFEYVTPRGQAVLPRPCDPGSCHICFHVHDISSMVTQLRSRNVDILGEPVEVDAGPNKGGLALYLRDPGGILIELFQPPRRAST